YPVQNAAVDQALTDDLLGITGEPPKNNGIAFGKQIAAAVLATRVGDGAELLEPRLGIDFFTSDLPGHWRQDPISLIPIALGAHCGGCEPFVIKSGSHFLAPPAHALTSAAYPTAET